MTAHTYLSIAGVYMNGEDMYMTMLLRKSINITELDVGPLGILAAHLSKVTYSLYNLKKAAMWYWHRNTQDSFDQVKILSGHFKLLYAPLPSVLFC